MAAEIRSFSGAHRFLSNFYPSPWVELDGLCYPTVEHAYQAAKTLDAERRYRIQQLATPGAAKRAGRVVPLRAGWEDRKVAVMRSLLERKFVEKNLRAALLATGDAVLIEGNDWGDTFWGVCRGVGENWLGRLLMDVRAVLAVRREG